MHMNPRIVSGGVLLGALEEVVGGPLDVAGAQENIHPAGGVHTIPLVGALEKGEVIVGGHVDGGQIFPQGAGQVGWQARYKLLIVAIDHPVLIAKVYGEGRPHSRVVESPEYITYIGLQTGDGSLSVVVHEGGGARFYHLQGGVKGS